MQASHDNLLRYLRNLRAEVREWEDKGPREFAETIDSIIAFANASIETQEIILLNQED